MAHKKRKLPALNGSSLADISFLFLIFFLLVSQISSDTGLPRRLPPPPQDDAKVSKAEVQKRNFLQVRVNSQGEVLVFSELGDVIYANDDELLGKGQQPSLKDKVKEFILNVNDDKSLPELITKDLGGEIGTVKATFDHIISLQNDATTKYSKYITVQNELVRAYSELRNDAANTYFGANYDKLDDESKSAVDKLYKQRISEAEPKNYGGEN